MNLSKVKHVEIYPPIGIARVGNSPDEYFLGPTIPGQAAKDDSDFRDAAGRIKRQASKFFIFGFDENGNNLGELNASHGISIDWRVDVANKKAAWYRFDIALDIPTAEGIYDLNGNEVPKSQRLPVLSQRRNLDYKGEKERKKLMIEARAQHIEGINKNSDGKTHHFKGTIGKEEEEVYLGELRTDEEGRLIFLGGRGHSASFNGSKLTTFANNDGWHDDTSDGPVDAVVKFPDGSELTAEGAWVLTSPPNFAVGVQAFSTGYDLLKDLMSTQHEGIKKAQPSFYQDIYPVLANLTINQWVNAGVSRLFGWGSAYEFDNEVLLARLNDKSDKNRPFRQTIFESFRNPDYKTMQAENWPPLYGDAVTFNVNSTDPRNWFAITPLKYDYLRQWAAGDFTVDEPLPPKSWDDMSPAEQANGLTEAALEETLGGPFHPGCEFTWPMRHAMMYNPNKPYRIKRRANAKEDFGVAINSDIINSKKGPLNGSSPGDLSKWMAVPWQADTSSCLSAYVSYAGEYLPTFWPARVPNDVLTEEDYHKIQSSDEPTDDKIAAFSPSSRKKWLRGYVYDVPKEVDGKTKFTEEWSKIGIILKKELNADSNLFPKEAWVETGRSLDDKEDTDNSLESTAPQGSAKKVAKRPDWMNTNPRLLR